MKKNYQQAGVEIIELDKLDIVTASQPNDFVGENFIVDDFDEVFFD